MSNTISSARDLIEKLGGTQKVADMLGVGYTAVSNMRLRGAFPPRHWPELIRRSATNGVPGITIDFLEQLLLAAEVRERQATVV